MTYTHGPDDEGTVANRNRSNRSRAIDIGRKRLEFDANIDAETQQLVEKFTYRRSETGVDRCYLHGRPIEAKQSGRADWHLEHVTPLVLGGGHTVSNLEVACSTCNLAKAGDTLEDYLGAEDAAELREWLRTNRIQPMSLRKRPVLDLWAVDCDADTQPGRMARRWSSAPRPFPYEPGGVPEWRTPRGASVTFDQQTIHRIILRVLLDQRDPYSAMTIPQISAKSRLHRPQGTNYSPSALRKEWGVCFGMCPDVGYREQIYRPSPWLVAVNLPSQPGSSLEAGFRLRFTTETRSSDDIDLNRQQRWMITGNKATDSRYPDVDGYAVPAGASLPTLE